MSKSLRLVFLIAVLGLASAASFDSRYFSPHGGETDNAKRSSEGLLQLISAVTNNTISTKLRDLPVGKTIQIGDATNGLKFVKVGESQYLSVAPQCPDPVLTTTGAQKLLTYKNSAQSYTFYAGCEYKIELWGAQGGVGHYTTTSFNYRNRFNYGAYTSGTLSVNKQVILYFYTGGKGTDQATSTINTHAAGGWNGGGYGGYSTGDDAGGGGGGATDIRTISGSWDNAESLRSRIMVAGAGGGTVSANYSISQSLGGYVAGGGLIISATTNQTASTNCNNVTTPESSNTSGNAFAQGFIGTDEKTPHGSGGGGGGWYGGRQARSTSCNYGSSAQGGTSYISGHTGCVAVTSTSSSSPKSGCTTGTTDNSCSISPYGYTFTNTVMIDGAGYQWTNTKGALKAMPNPNGGNYASGVGHTGNGYARITRLN